jgi:hypothetical protein
MKNHRATKNFVAAVRAADTAMSTLGDFKGRDRPGT